MFEFRRQPFKAIYYTYFIASTIIRLPYWFLRSLPPFLRPRKTWSMKRAFILLAMRAFIASWFATSIPPSPGENPEEIASSDEAEKLGFVWVPSLNDDLVVGEIREVAKRQGVASQKPFGYWYQRENVTEKRDRKAGPDEKVILHFHGGGFITGSAHPKGGAIGPITAGLLQHCPRISRIFAGGYRISSSAPFPARNPFPAALLDGLACYHYLIHTSGFSPENIIISGDSAGGNIAIAVARYVAIHRLSELTTSGALLLLSPTVEWGLTHIGKDSSMQYNAGSDLCGQLFHGYTERSLIGKMEPKNFAFTSPWISPASLNLSKGDVDGLFVGLPRTYMMVGDAEICLDSYRTLCNRITADIGNENLTYVEMRDSTHDFIAMTWHEPERTQSLKGISAWIDSL